MPWPFRINAAPTERGNDQRMLQLERRVAFLERRPTSRAITAVDFTASENETIDIDAPSTGLTALLPQATSRNRHATVRLIHHNSNPVTLRAINGTVNGQPLLLRTRVGSYTAVSDGETGWWIESLLPRRPRELAVQDFFISGNTTTGSIGALGWNLLGVGTPVVTRTSGAALDNGRLNVTTSAASNDRSTLCLAATEAGTVCRPDEIFATQAIVNMAGDLANKRVFIGFAETFATAPASVSNSLGFLYDSSVNGNWHTIHRFGTTGSATDTTIAATSSGQTLLTIWQKTTKVWELRIGERSVASFAQSTNVTVLPVNLGFRVETLTTAAKTLRLAYFGAESVNLGATYDDDPFLQR